MKYKRIKNRFRKWLKVKFPDAYEGDFAFLNNREDLIWEYHDQALAQAKQEGREEGIEIEKQRLEDIRVAYKKVFRNKSNEK